MTPRRRRLPNPSPAKPVPAGQHHGAQDRPQRLFSCRRPTFGTNPPPGLQRRQQFFPQPLGHRPGHHHRPRRPGPAVQHQRLPELPYQGRARPPARPRAPTMRCRCWYACRSRIRPALCHAHRTGWASCPSRSMAASCRTWPSPVSSPRARCGSTTTPVTVTFQGRHGEVELRKPTPADHPARLRPDAPRCPHVRPCRAADDRPGPARSHPRRGRSWQNASKRPATKPLCGVAGRPNWVWDDAQQKTVLGPLWLESRAAEPQSTKCSRLLW
jgi:hypothetical protein